MKPKRPAWSLAIGGLITIVNLASAQNWTLTSAPQATGESSWNWMAVACSADGNKLVAAGWKGRNCSLGFCDYFDIASTIYTSADAGLTWTQTSSPTNVWSAIASSADGAKLVALSASGIYTSTNSGVTWTKSSAITNGWSSMASSADGTKLAAAAFGSPLGDGLIYTSDDSGMNWTPASAPSNSWTSVVSSADGTELVAAGGGNDTNGQAIGSFIYASIDSGATWTQSGAPNNSWSSLAASADGTKLAAAVALDINGNGGGIYTSMDSGTTWTQSSALSNLGPFSAVASSADGTTLAAAAASWYQSYGGPATALGIYRSTDSGATWTFTLSSLAGGVPSLACSADGDFMLAAGFGIYTWPYSGPWKMNIGSGAPNGLAGIASSSDGAKLVAAGGASYDTNGAYVGNPPPTCFHPPTRRLTTTR